MKSIDFLIKVLITQIAAYFLYIAVWTLFQMLSGILSGFELVKPLVLLIVLAQSLHFFTTKAKKFKVTKFTATAIALVSFTLALMFGLISYLSGGFTLDVCVDIAFITLIGIWTLVFYFSITKGCAS